MAFLCPLPWHFICYWEKMGNVFLLLWRSACSAPSTPAYMSASLHLGPLWSPVAPRRWEENVPSTWNPTVSVYPLYSLIWNPSCSKCCWEPEETSPRAPVHCRTDLVRPVLSLWWEGSKASLLHQLCKNKPKPLWFFTLFASVGKTSAH